MAVRRDAILHDKSMETAGVEAPGNRLRFVRRAVVVPATWTNEDRTTHARRVQRIQVQPRAEIVIRRRMRWFARPQP
jgi:hypothetical protein